MCIYMYNAYVYVCIYIYNAYVCVYTYISVGGVHMYCEHGCCQRHQKRGTDLLELELQQSSATLWLEVEPRFLVRAASALKCQATPPLHPPCFISLR